MWFLGLTLRSTERVVLQDRIQCKACFQCVSIHKGSLSNYGNKIFLNKALREDCTTVYPWKGDLLSCAHSYQSDYQCNVQVVKHNNSRWRLLQVPPGLSFFSVAGYSLFLLLTFLGLSFISFLLSGPVSWDEAITTVKVIPFWESFVNWGLVGCGTLVSKIVSETWTTSSLLFLLKDPLRVLVPFWFSILCRRLFFPFCGSF